jgi:hypothetical protein
LFNYTGAIRTAVAAASFQTVDEIPRHRRRREPISATAKPTEKKKGAPFLAPLFYIVQHA